MYELFISKVIYAKQDYYDTYGDYIGNHMEEWLKNETDGFSNVIENSHQDKEGQWIWELRITFNKEYYLLLFKLKWL